jgi:hypothetical protein
MRDCPDQAVPNIVRATNPPRTILPVVVAAVRDATAARLVVRMESTRHTFSYGEAKPQPVVEDNSGRIVVYANADRLCRALR